MLLAVVIPLLLVAIALVSTSQSLKLQLQEEEFWSNVRARRERRDSEGDKDDFRQFAVSELNLGTRCF